MHFTHLTLFFYKKAILWITFKFSGYMIFMMPKSKTGSGPCQGFHFQESHGISWKWKNVLECPGIVQKCPGKSKKLLNFRKFRFIGIWNDGCCSISLKFEIPASFLGKNVMEINSNVLESPGNDSRHLSGEPCTGCLSLAFLILNIHQ